MPAVETATAFYLYGAEPSMTAMSSRAAQQQVLFIPNVSRRPMATPESATNIEGTSTAQEDVIPTESQLTQADLMIAQLLRMEQLDANWDGSEAAKPLEFSLKDACAFIRALAPESVIPRPALHADGHAILFLRGQNVYAELEFLGNKRIGYYARRGGQEWSDETDFDGRTLPEGLSQLGFAT
jgi:hypothetical protein